MESLFSASVLGIVEGLTEFIPVSSSGHLILCGHLLDFSGARAATFEVVIQVGAILAVVALYWQRFLSLLIPRKESPFSGMRGLYLLLLTTLPAAGLGLLLHGFIKSLFTPLAVSASLLFGALMIFIIENRIARLKHDMPATSLDHITAKQALGIGCFQCLALWPGFSRSAATIMGGMLLGVHRKTAAEYSFIAAVPIISGAALFDLIKSFSLFTSADIPFFLVGTITAFLSAVLAIRFFIALLGNCTLRPFAWYRILLALPVYFFMAS